MEDPEVIDATVDSSTTNQDDNQDSSPEALGEATSEQAVQEKETPFHEHPRWKEIQEEKEYYKQQLAALINKPNVIPQQPVVEKDRYAGMTAEEKAFYQAQDERARQIAREVAAEEKAGVLKELNETRQILATVAYERFQSKHPDVLPNSQEERTIATLYSKGYNLEDAYKVAMFDKVQQDKAQQAKAKQTQVVKQKLAANVETSTIPSSSGLPQGKRKTMKEFVEEQIASGKFSF